MTRLEMAEMLRNASGGTANGIVVQSLREVLADLAQQGPRRFVVQDLMLERSYGVLAAEFKGQKSYDVADLTVSVASGTPWLNRFEVGVSGPVLVFYNEGDKEELVRRMRAVADSRAIELEDLKIHVSITPPKLQVASSMEGVLAELDRIRPVLTALDPLYQSAGGADGKSLYAMGESLASLQQVFLEAETTGLVTHHYNRDSTRKGVARMSGAGPAEWGRFLIAADVTKRTAIPGGTEMIRRMEATGSSVPEQVYIVRRTITTERPGEADSPVIYDTSVTEPPADTHSGVRLSPSRSRVLGVLGGPDLPLTRQEIGDRVAADGTTGTGLHTETLLAALRELVDLGFADSATDSGRASTWWRTS
jgi:AAA domain